jgi:hypothetical protein
LQEKTVVVRNRQNFKLNLIFGLGEKVVQMLVVLFQPIEFVVEIKITDGGAGKASKTLFFFQATPALSHFFLHGRHTHNSA